MTTTKHATNKPFYTVFIHLGFWCLVFLWPLLSVEDITRVPHILNRNWLFTSSLLVIFYINYFILIDQLFFKKKKPVFYIINLILIAGIAFIVSYFSEMDVFNPTMDGVRMREMRSTSISQMQLVLSMVLCIGMCVGLKTNKRWSKGERILQEAKQAQLSSEIKYLKYQIQPHFLFNTLNNIYSLIDGSPDIAKTSIHSLSKMMRYLLHDSNTDRVPLSKEVDFLERYIDLMRLRVSGNFTLKKNFPVINQPVQIAPLLLVSFIENAFKHGVDAIQASHIEVELTLENNQLRYRVINSSFPQSEKAADSGIGLENLRKRLELLYTNQFELLTEEKDGIHTASLTLNY